MVKKLIGVAALSACSLASAATERLNFLYKGFYLEHLHEYKPDALRWLQVDAEDLNKDGSYTLDELASFQFHGIYQNAGLGQLGCFYGPDSHSCLSSFSYTPGSAPVFAASSGWHIDSGYHDWTVESGVRYTDISVSWFSSRHWVYQWTDQTQLIVGAIPEPSTYAMLSAGLAGMLAFARRRRA
ncbi:PEP-CTERM sorting domain-containing protein [Pseudoduganella armeniaca]|uniref:Ice-binding protein C-terminal domain-containing protein n=1 Tax=Pseudoduganella armeniaca TaxID=2072590 RepID=A0A2R4C9N1_9BURK|nr:PEP-CTERM sorting domain-containing protein [Pseudoduganella armeniaca]AVR96282.1 hypothetical protein C9I28_11620 [Pseudoduganella armeniaca]